MASTIIIYEGDGTTVDFTVPFDYLKKTFVKVILNNAELKGGDYGDTSVGYYFLEDTTVRLKTAPASGSELTIRRYTSATDRVVTFKDASILKATDLDTSQLQAFHIAEEARDIINDALVKDRDGNWDAKGNRIVNVGDPVNENDAMTYGFYRTDKENVKDLVEEAEGYRDQALQYRNEAEAIKGDTQAIKDETNQIKTETEGIRDATQQIKEETQQIKEDAVEETSDLVALAKDWAIKMDAEVNGEDYSSKYWANEAKKIKPKLDIVADNIDDVVNVSNSMDDVNIVAGDLDGQISASIGIDMGRVGTGSSSDVEITGGNIKTVADNISDVQAVGNLIESGQVDTIINAVTTTNENATKAKQSEANAKVSETNAKTSETNAKASENLAKDWAIKTDGLVNNEDYSSKYWAQQAKASADDASGTAGEISQAVEQGKQAISSAVTSGISQVNAAGTTQVGLVEDEGEAQVQLVTSEGTKQKGELETATQEHIGQLGEEGKAQVKAVTDAGAAQASAVNTAGTTQTGLVTSEGTKQVGLVTEAGTAQVAAVGSAGTKATEVVNTSKDNAVTAVSAEGTNQVTLVQQAGSTAMTTINSSVGLAKAWASKMDGPVEGEEYSAKYWANQASFGQVQADWNQTIDTEVDYIKNKPDLSVYALKTDISTVFRYKGSVDTYSQLPSDTQAVGDVYNIATDDNANNIHAGDNVVWNGTYWDNLSGAVELSGYVTSAYANSTYLKKVDASTTYATKTELGNKLDKSTANSTFATKTELTEGLSGKMNTATANSTFATKSALTSGLAGKSDSNHTHTTAGIADFTAQVNTLINNSRTIDYGRVGN